MIFMTTLSKLSFQEKRHGLFFFLKKETCSRKHDEKKESWTHEDPKYSEKKSWTHEGPGI